MIYISSFVYCDNISQERLVDGRPFTQIVNPLQAIKPISLPGNFSFSIMCIMSGFENNEVNQFNLQMISPKGEVIQNTGDIPLGGKLHIEEQEKIPKAVQICMDFRNVVFKEKGDYTAILKVNGKKIGEYKIPVVEGD